MECRTKDGLEKGSQNPGRDCRGPGLSQLLRKAKACAATTVLIVAALEYFRVAMRKRHARHC